jgi:hypothetical protein
MTTFDPGAAPTVPYTPQPAARPPRKWVLPTIIVITAVTSCAAGALVGYAAAKSPTAPAAATTPAPPTTAYVAPPTATTPAAQPTTAKPAPPPPGIHGDGTFLVPSEVRPGRYRATVPADSYGCYWERLKGTSGSFSDIIANGNGEPGARMTVTIGTTDKAFHTEGCGDWAKV